MPINKNKVASNLFWRFADKWGTQLISLVISTMIARVVNPEAYGVVAIANALITIFSTFSDCGLGSSIVQKKDADELDYSTALIANLLLCGLVYLALYMLAPSIANFYKNDNLSSLIRVSSLSILISGFKNIQHAYVAKNLLFKKYFYSSIIGTVGAGIIGVYLAYNNYGAWSLVISNLFDVFIDTIIAFIIIDWRPKTDFSFERFKKLFNFGSKILVIELLAKIYNKLYQMIIGRYYTSNDLAYFDKGDSISSKLTENISYSISSVLFPVMSNHQDNKEEIKRIAKRTLKLNTYIIAPMLVGLCAVSNNLISVIFTDKWLPSTYYLKVYCLIRMFMPLIDINIAMIKATGKSKTLLKIHSIEYPISFIVVLITASISLKAMIIGLLINNIIKQFLCSHESTKIIDYSIIDQLKDIIPNLIISFAMGAIVYSLGFIYISKTLLLLMQILSGILIYIILSLLTKNDSFIYLFGEVKEFLRKQNS